MFEWLRAALREVLTLSAIFALLASAALVFALTAAAIPLIILFSPREDRSPPTC